MKHPAGLYLLFATEMWERFSYYGMRALLTLYMINALKFTDESASLLYGNYTGLVYLTPLIGGYISDRYWGNRRSILVGGVVMAAGQFMLSASAFLAGTGIGAQVLFFAGLLSLVIGNGFFKPNISTMVNQLYAPGDRRVDSAFSIFYMGINLGAFFSPLVCGYLGQQIGFGWGFLAAGVGMVAGIGLFEALKHQYLITNTGAPIGGTPSAPTNAAKDAINAIGTPQTPPPLRSLRNTNSTTRILIWLGAWAVLWGVFMLGAGFNFVSTLIFATSIASAGFIITDPALTPVERDRIWSIYIIAFFVIFFWSAFEQAGASLTIIADRNVDRVVGGYEVPASFFQSINPLTIILFAPLFAVLWQWLGGRNLEPASPVKQAMGLGLLAVGYGVIAFGVMGLNPQNPEDKMPMLLMVGMYLLHTLGELCLSPIGLSMVARLAPARLASLLMGVWFMSNAMANDFAGMLSSYIPAGDGTVKSFLGYQIATLYDFFMLFVVMAGAGGIVLFFLSRRLLAMMHGIR